MTNYKEYGCILWQGILALTISTTIFTFLLNVTSIEVLPDTVNYLYLRDGIHCEPIDNPQLSAYCDMVTDEIFSYVNNESISSDRSDENITFIVESTDQTDQSTLNDWKCELYTDYSQYSFFEFKFILTFGYFTLFFAALIFSSVCFCVCAVNHDWALVQNKNKINEIEFSPNHADDFFCARFLMLSQHRIETRHKCIKYLFIFFVVIGLLFDTFILQPVITIICPCHFMDQLYTDKEPENKCKTVIRAYQDVSSYWVGFARFLMIIACTSVFFTTAEGFSRDIESLDPDICECECYYRFRETDFLKFVWALFLLIVLTLKFIWEWAGEVEHGYHFLYLVKYSLPIHIVHALNPEDSTGTLMVADMKRHQLGSSHNLEVPEEDKEEKEWGVARFIIFWMNVGTFVIAFGVAFMITGLYNIYEDPYLKAASLSIGIILLIVGVVCLIYGFHDIAEKMMKEMLNTEEQANTAVELATKNTSSGN